MRVNKPGFIKRFIWWLNLAAAFSLLLAFLASYISPAKLWWLAYFGLAFEILFIVNLLFVSYWLLSKSRRFVLSLFLVLVGFSKFLGIIQYNFGTGNEEEQKANGYIKVMTFNVRLFDLYNWFHNKETREKIFEFLKKESPDIICIQEFYTSDKKDPAFRNEDALHENLKAQFSQLEYTVTMKETDHWGMATYSKYPIINKSSKRFAKKGGSIFIISDIKIGNDTIRVFNTHLQSIHFGWSDYKFIQNINNDEVEQDEIKGGLKILRRLKKAFVKRASQVETLRDSISKSPYPVLVCGDFNDTPSSYTYAVIAGNLKDAFRESGRGAGKTYAGPFPSFRIDYILHDKKITSDCYRTVKEKLSDHYPVACLIKVDGR
jgi:endonuclease/exonuclease/phosphatase family metal-dependent hydrolase